MKWSALGAPFAPLLQYRNLTTELAKRDILGRYRGAGFGLLWSLLTPLLMLTVYAVTFGEILRSRWVAPDGTTSEFVPVLFLGIIIHAFFSECVSRSPRVMQENVNFVKRVVFPLHVLSWSIALAALFHLVTNLLIFTVLVSMFFGGVSAQIVFLPLVLMPLFLITVASSWFVSSLGVYLRDLQQVVPVIMTAMFFLSPAIIPLDSVPENYRWIFELNPLTFFIEQARNVSLWGMSPDWASLGTFAAAGLILVYAGHAWMRVTSRGFSDVL